MFAGVTGDRFKGIKSGEITQKDLPKPVPAQPAGPEYKDWHQIADDEFITTTFGEIE